MCGITSSSKAASPSRSCRGHTPQSSKTRWTATCGRMCSASVPPLTPHLIFHAHMDYLSLSRSLSHTPSLQERWRTTRRPRLLRAVSTLLPSLAYALVSLSLVLSLSHTLTHSLTHSLNLALSLLAAPPESGVRASVARLRSGLSLPSPPSLFLSLPLSHTLTYSRTHSLSLPPSLSRSASPPSSFLCLAFVLFRLLWTLAYHASAALPKSGIDIASFARLRSGLSLSRSLYLSHTHSLTHSLTQSRSLPPGCASRERRRCLRRSPALWTLSLSPALPFSLPLFLSCSHTQTHSLSVPRLPRAVSILLP